MLEGMVVGGWGFITAAYLITGTVLVLYVWSLFARLRGLEERSERE